jgi:hypothetical protein
LMGQQQQWWALRKGRGGVDFAVPHLWYGKVWAELTPAQRPRRKRRKMEGVSVARVGLSSYLYRPCTIVCSH